MFVPHKKRLCHRARGLRVTEGGVFSSSSPTPVPHPRCSLQIGARFTLRCRCGGMPPRVKVWENVGCGGAWASIQVPPWTPNPLFPGASAGGVGRRAMRRARHSKYFPSRRQLTTQPVHAQKHLPGPRSRTTDLTTPKCRKKRPPVLCPLATPLRRVSPSPPRLYKTAQLSGAPLIVDVLPTGAIAGVSEVLGHSRCAWPTR